MLDLLRQNPLLLLFVVAAIGYLVGQIRLSGFSLGVAAVLFVGLGFGALAPDLKLPDIVYQLGLVLFVYTVALSSGPSFFANLGRRGLRYNLLVLGVLVFAALLIALLGRWLGFGGPLMAGLFAGALTNTPALAAAVETLHNRGASEALQNLPTAAYAVAYPMGVIGMLLAIHLAWRWWGKGMPAAEPPLRSMTIEVNQGKVVGWTIEQLAKAHDWKVVFGRLRRGQDQQLLSADTTLQPGDWVSVVGSPDQLEKVVQTLGHALPERLEEDHHVLDSRRVLVSSREVAGRSLSELQLPDRYGVVVTRVGRGDVELLAEAGTVLELGDRLRVVGARDSIQRVAQLMGDSYRGMAEVDGVSLGLGIALGLLLGNLTLPLPGGSSFKLGLAGGTLLVGLMVGALGRTGPILWQMPYAANLTLRQIGLVLFLAGVGTRSGYAFALTLSEGSGLVLFLAGAVVTLSAALLTLWIGQRMKIRLDVLCGVLAGLQTQPAVLAFAVEKTGTEQANLGYASVYPLSMLLKIVLVQVLLL